MFVILCYDVQSERVKKMMKTAKKYLHPVQRSVFEGNLTQAALHRMQDEIEALIRPETDSVALYCLQSAGQVEKLQIGVFPAHDDSFL